jgi:hypothetical protein
MASSLCIRCKGKGLCGQPCKILNKFIDSLPQVKTHFSGSTPPEIFVGRANYPNVFSGILSPNQHGNTEIFSTPEQWYKNKLSIDDILGYRGQMIYARKTSHIKSEKNNNSAFQELALASKPVSTEFFLEKKPKIGFSADKIFHPMTHPAILKKAILEENPIVPQKVDYLTGDYDVKAITALKELYKNRIPTSHLQKLLSAGLLGVKPKRILVPTRWSITAVDDILSKSLLEKIKYYPELNEIILFHNYYNGNHYEILLLPDTFSFEVIEIDFSNNVWNNQELSYMQDYEGFFNRKTYAKNVTGAYYANRLAIVEYLERIKKQASVLIIREVRQEYYAPLGVGILRETTRDILNKQPQKPKDINHSLELMQLRLKSQVEKIKNISIILKNYKKQLKINSFLK